MSLRFSHLEVRSAESISQQLWQIAQVYFRKATTLYGNEYAHVYEKDISQGTMRFKVVVQQIFKYIPVFVARLNLLLSHSHSVESFFSSGKCKYFNYICKDKLIFD